jgi:hypothetical protein
MLSHSTRDASCFLLVDRLAVGRQQSPDKPYWRDLRNLRVAEELRHGNQNMMRERRHLFVMALRDRTAVRAIARAFTCAPNPIGHASRWGGFPREGCCADTYRPAESFARSLWNFTTNPRVLSVRHPSALTQAGFLAPRRGPHKGTRMTARVQSVASLCALVLLTILRACRPRPADAQPIGFGDRPDPGTVEGHRNAMDEAAETRRYKGYGNDSRQNGPFGINSLHKNALG